MENEAYRFWAGVDWGSEEHRVVVVDRQKRIVREWRVPHTGADLAACAHALAELAAGAVEAVAVAIEVPRGAVVETFLAQGFHVYAINPKQLDRFRDRYSVAGAKDDRRDGFVLAISVLTDREAFRRVQPEDPRVVRLRELTRLENDLDTEQRRLSNRLREQLYRIAPGLLALCPGADEPWLWALLERAPTPAAAAALARAAIARVLVEHRIRRVTADQVYAVLRAPALAVGPGVVAAAEDHLAMLLPRLRLIAEQRRDCAARTARVLRDLTDTQEHRDVAILQSLPGVGRKISATMLAEASQLLAARDYHALRAHAGTAPVTIQSGKSRQIRMRYSCNVRLRNAVHHWASTSVRHDPPSRALYQTARARGCNHNRAVRGVADRLLAVLIAMLRTQTLYDPRRRTQPAPAA
jgi:transposase